MNKSGIVRTALLASILGIVAGGFAGCSGVEEPWDKTGHFKQDRERSSALDSELRQRALEQADRTYG
jgi:hypothetical protein